jgi:hypothetical protein
MRGFITVSFRLLVVAVSLLMKPLACVLNKSSISQFDRSDCRCHTCKLPKLLAKMAIEKD